MNEFEKFRRQTPGQYLFEEVDEEGLQKAKIENRNPFLLYLNRYSPDIYSDDAQELIRLFVISCPFLANNQCSIFDKKTRPKACDSFQFDGSACQERQLFK